MSNSCSKMSGFCIHCSKSVNHQFEHTVRNIKPEIHRLDLMYEDLDFKYQHNLHDTLLGLKVPTVGFGNPKLSCVKIRSESKSNTLFTLTI